MASSLKARIGGITAIVAILAIVIAALALVAAHRMDLATRKLLLSQAQLESALRLRAAPYVGSDGVPALLARYREQIDAEDRLAVTEGEHREQAIERNDLATLRTIFAAGARGPMLDRITERIARREQAETAQSRLALARTERMIALGAAGIGAILLGCALCFVAMLRRSILRPIRLLLATIEGFDHGKGSPMPRAGLAREFGVLADGLNAMTGHISWQRGQLLALNRRLEERVAAQSRALAQLSAIELDRDMRLLHCSGRTVALTERECALMDLLLRRGGRVVSRDQVLLHAWENHDDASDNLVDVYVGYLRRKLRRLEARWEIATIRGAGFTLRQRSGAGQSERPVFPRQPADEGSAEPPPR